MAKRKRKKLRNKTRAPRLVLEYADDSIVQGLVQGLREIRRQIQHRLNTPEMTERVSQRVGPSPFDEIGRQR